jgi:hypothetical protein
MARRTPESLADYLAIAVCPALIMFLVGSLVFFLIEVFYQGQYEGRLLFVMAMFVMAIVCIARISIEQDVGYASLFALPLAGVVLMAMSFLVRIEGPLASIGLIVNMTFMGIVWWSAHKLTWDCTVIDDSQEASGQGLLQEIGLDPSPRPEEGEARGMSSRSGDMEAVTTRTPEPQRQWWERLLETDRRPHAPGVWVVYFSLAALPLFGFGGWFVPSGDAASRAHAFQWLVIYVGSALALLLATSFLGLRRYLRRRRLEMPLEMTATWVTLGVALIGATLVGAAILPRPRAEYSLTQLPVVVTSAVRRASKFATGKEGTEDQSPDRSTTTEVQDGQQPQQQGSKQGGKSGQASDGSKGEKQAGGEGKGKSGGSQGKSNERAEQGKASDGNQQSDKSKGNGDKSKGEAGGEREGEKAADQSQEQQAGEQQEQKAGERSAELAKSEAQPQSESHTPAQSSQTLSQLTSIVIQGITTIVRWLFYGALLAAAIAIGWIYRAELLAAWQKLLAELRELWASWFGVKPVAANAAAETPPAPPPRPFASYTDPFLSGTARRMSWPELVGYTFEATEAWARERGAARTAGQTPHEFAVALAQVEPPLGSSVQTLAAWYSKLAYAPRSKARGPAEALEQLWRLLRTTAAPPIAISTTV